MLQHSEHWLWLAPWQHVAGPFTAAAVHKRINLNSKLCCTHDVLRNFECSGGLWDMLSMNTHTGHGHDSPMVASVWETAGALSAAAGYSYRIVGEACGCVVRKDGLDHVPAASTRGAA